MHEAHDVELKSIQAEGMPVFQEFYRFVLEQAGDLEAADVERDVLRRVAEIGRLALQAFFSARGTGDVGPSLERKDGSIYVREGRVHTRVYLSLFGKVEVRRTGQGDFPDAMGSVADLQECHGVCFSFGLRLTQFFMLITWLFSVSWSMRAAVR
jgi:hypothetical protein